MDHHTVAIISITGSCLDVLGSLYLAYDLLGGEHGPLRLLTRVVTYLIIYFISFGNIIHWLGEALFSAIRSLLSALASTNVGYADLCLGQPGWSVRVFCANACSTRTCGVFFQSCVRPPDIIDA